jgi:nucleoside-diphosphate-sugar epimerase
MANGCGPRSFRDLFSREPPIKRVDDLLADWQEVAGAEVAAPVVLEGDISSPGCGLSDEAVGWVAENVDELVHSAASLSFELREADGEPYRSNVEGTNQVLALCEGAGIRRLHHVSTAYVCGLREGTIREDELDVGQESGNDYEKSKMQSERSVREAPFLETLTVHRPSVIVGDLVSGFTNTFHGFYRPLRILQPVLAALVENAVSADSLIEELGMDGSERKNLVPADWVSAVMTRIILDETLHGGTYHLTSGVPTSVDLLRRVFQDLLLARKDQHGARQLGGEGAAALFSSDLLRKTFSDQMRTYRAYWRDDPVFDTAATQRAAPDLPTPALDEAALRRLCGFALDHNFTWAPQRQREGVANARGLLERTLGAPRWKRPERGFGLSASGAGGGQWTVDGKGQLLHVGLPRGAAAMIYLRAETLAAILSGRRSASAACSAGLVALEGGDAAARQATIPLLDRLATGSAAEPETSTI